MPLITVGINHTTAPVDFREKVAIIEDQIPSALCQLIKTPSIEEAAIISTCNRTELYCYSLNEQTGKAQALKWLADHKNIRHEELQAHSYQYHHRDSIRHLFRVASGLDSLVLGEPQILGQLKAAYRQASEAGTAGKQLNPLFQHAFSVAKRVRTDTTIGVNPVSVASTTVTLAKRIFGSLDTTCALFIGAGDTIRLAITHMHDAGVRSLYVANRSIERAENLAAEFHGEGIGLNNISDVLVDCDVVVTATASPLPILGKGLLERCIKKRKHKPIFIVDLAVPRDVEPEAGDLADIYLYAVDDLQEVIEESMASRQEAAESANHIIDTEVQTYWSRLHSDNAVDLIKTYRNQAEAHKNELLLKANRMLEQGKPSEQVMEYFANGLMNKLLHNPTEALKSAAQQERNELLSAARYILGLKDSDRDDSPD